MNSQRLYPLLGLKVLAKDGEVGKVYDFYLTDDAWRVAYVVISTGSFFSERRLIVPPQMIAFDSFHPDTLHVNRTREEILASPDWDKEKPVSRQKREELGDQFIWLPSGSLTHIVFRPLGASDEALRVDEDRARASGDNPHLRSLAEIRGYEALDRQGNKMGRLVDAVADSTHWTVPMVCIKTPADSSDAGAVISVRHIDTIDWANARARIEIDHDDLALLPVEDDALPAYSTAR
jgi:sporulation protein YlmC with PRC-barrel domain